VSRATELTSSEVSKLDALVARLNEVVEHFIGGNAKNSPAGGREYQPERGLKINPELPGELSFAKMMNPQPPSPGGRVPDFFSPLQKAGPATPGLMPLPPNAGGSGSGEEDAA
jgi:hypothetical protein